MPNSEELKFAFGGPSKEAYDRASKRLEDAITALERPQNSFERVMEFMVAFGHPVLEKPTLIEDEAWEAMRLNLILEEFFELMEACGYDTEGFVFDVRDVPKVVEGNLIQIADALGDLEYVINGMAIGTGIPLPKVVKEIHRSNMTKLGVDGKPIYREDGKILKGPGYEPPSLQGILF